MSIFYKDFINPPRGIKVFVVIIVIIKNILNYKNIKTLNEKI